MRKFIVSVIVGVLVVVGTLAGATAAQAKVVGFIPADGVKFNNPLGSKVQVRALIRKVNRTIDATPPGAHIRIASWNVRSRDTVAALLRAHRRGVSVRVVMDYLNWNPNNPNQDADRLKAGLSKGNAKRAKTDTSWLRRCRGSCRGGSGIAHTKYFLFDHVRGPKRKNPTPQSKYYTKRWVVMYGSYNATELGATIQWNDLYTISGDKDRYTFFENVFKQSAKDKRVKQGYVSYTKDGIKNYHYPYTGKGTKVDPTIAALNRISCRRAGTRNGITKIRIAQTSMHGPRGLKLAKKLVSMRREGCDIKIAYAMFGGNVLKLLRNAPIAVTHLAYDRNDDGVYDVYLHSKSMAVHGRIDGKPNSYLTWNGSANWTGVALVSDEVVGEIKGRETTKKYIDWIDQLLRSRPAVWGRSSVLTKKRGVDPYALIKQEN